MANQPTDAQLKAGIKKQFDKDGDRVTFKTNIPALAESLPGNVTAKDIVMRVRKLEVDAVPSLAIKPNKGDIVKAKKNGIRWEQIAARAGISVAEARNIGGAEAEALYAGRGTRGGNGTGKPKAASGRRQQKAATGKGQSGRRQKANKGNSAGRKPRARTRAERAAKAGDPK
jgi:hypothetical protein